MKSKPKELIAILFVVLVIMILGVGLSNATTHAAIVILALNTGIILFVIIELIRRLKIQFTKEIRDGVAQNEAYLALIDTIKPRLPLPATRGWAASPDFLRIVAQHIIELKPMQTVELGAGVSSIVTGYLLDKQGGGKLLSLEHDSEYATKQRTTLKMHKVESKIEIFDKPFKEYDINGKQWKWYAFPEMAAIDLLVIDGPPKHIQNLARYPALPLLKKYLKPGSVILADDTNREDLQEIINMWQKEFPTWQFESLTAEKGAYKIVVTA